MNRTEEQSVASVTRWQWFRQCLPVLALAVATAVLVTIWAPHVWLVLPADGLLVLILIAAAAGWGAWPAAWLGLGRESGGKQSCVACAIGLGILSTLGLTLGAAGLLTRVTGWGLLVAGGLLGATRIHHVQHVKRRATPSQATVARIALQCLALLPLCVPLAVAVYGATLPPGLLWNGEARGYDVLEYHLQVPREYFETGQIHFLPHNVYASFPAGVETHYLLLMHLMNDPFHAAIPAQLFHVALGVLAVVALVSWSQCGWTRILVALVAGSVPWLAYVGCLAYVELGMLFFAAVAGGLVVDQVRSAQRPDWRPALAAGLCAGLAGGCKYTALILVAVALGLAWLIAMRASLKTRVLRFTLFGVGALVAVSPWLIRNAALAGNPVHPFAYKWFGGHAWSGEQDEQWAQGHRMPPERDSLGGRARVAVDELCGSGMYGPTLWLLPIAALALSPSRRNWLLIVWLAMIVLAWALLTHMPGRFAIPVVIPLSLMLGDVRARSEMFSRRSRLITAALVLVAAAGALANDVKLWRLLDSESQRWKRVTRIPLSLMVDRTDFRRVANCVNQVAAAGSSYVWLVGDARAYYVVPRAHYTVTFCRDPWLEYAAGGASPEQCVAWLRTQNVTHVVFSWTEIDRLRGSYGFSPVVTHAWVRQLEAAGLWRIRTEGDAEPHSVTEFYEVLPE